MFSIASFLWHPRPGTCERFRWSVSSTGITARWLQFGRLAYLPPLLLLALVHNARSAEFIPLGLLPGGDASFASGVSDDGSVVAGHASSEAFRWTESTGMVALGVLPGGLSSYTGGFDEEDGISGDGSVIVGYSQRREGGFFTSDGFIYTVADGMRSLDVDYAADASFDGSVVAGTAAINGHSEAFRWTEDEGVVGLGLSPDGRSSWGSDVSADGSVVVGQYGVPFGDVIGGEVFRWTATTGMVGLGILATNPYPCVSSDGSVVGGNAYITSQANSEAILWKEDTGIIELGWLPGTAEDDGANWSSVTGISDNGTVIGFSGRTRKNRRGFIWTEELGMQDLKQVLTYQYELGASLEGWTLRAPTDISANGQYIVGNGYNPNGDDEGWLVRLDATFPVPLGDVNLDGEVNGLDVDPFVDVLLNGPYQPEADMNEDQVVNGLDVDPFVAAVVGGAQSIPEPSTLLLCLLALTLVGGWRKWGG